MQASVPLSRAAVIVDRRLKRRQVFSALIALLVCAGMSWATYVVAQESPAAETIAVPATEQDGLAKLPYRDCFEASAYRYNLDPKLLASIAIVESSLDPNAVSGSDAIGLMQIKWPITASHLGIEDRLVLFEPCSNIDAGAKYLRELFDSLRIQDFERKQRLVLASYRLGPSGFEPNLPLPPVAKDYIQKVEAQRAGLRSAAETLVLDSTEGQRQQAMLPCVIEDMRVLAASTHDPQERKDAAAAWMTARGPACSTIALLRIRNNLALWLGTAMSAEIEDSVVQLLETSIRGRVANPQN